MKIDSKIALKYLLKILQGSLVWAAIILLWQFLANINVLNLNFVAAPSGIISSFSKIEFWKIFFYDVAFSLNRIIIGLLLAFLTSYFLVFLGLIVPKGLYILSRIHLLVKYIPAPVLIPISILIFGINEQTKIAVIFFTILVLQINYLLGIIEKDEQKYSVLQKSWKISQVERFTNFIFPISTFLYYRALPSIVIWTFSMDIISEIILGGDNGLGIRIIQFQQIYNANYLYSYLVLIIILAFGVERILVEFFSRLKFDWIKIFSGSVMIASLLFCLVFSFLNYGPKLNAQGLKILTYKATANLPLLVYKKKFNSDFQINIEYVGSGLQVMDALLSEKANLGGYSDMPNVISGISKANNLKIISQVVEKPDHPNLFFISKTGDEDNLSSLDDTKIGYYPNNLIIKQGLDFVLFTKQVRTSSVEYISSNDPSNLVQAYISGKISSLLTIEPYATDLEQKTGDKRINDLTTFVKGANFDKLPLAGLVINSKNISKDDQNKFKAGLDKSIDFIRDNIDSRHIATGELRQIMQENDINPDSRLSAYETGDEIDSKDLETLINYSMLYKVDGLENLQNIKPEDMYLK